MEQRAKEPVPQRAVRMSQWGQYAEHVEVMALAHLTGRSFLVYDVVEDTLLPLGQEQEDGRKPIMLRLSHANDEKLAHYDLLVPMNDNMLEHGTQRGAHSGRTLQATAASFVPTAGRKESSRAASMTDAEEDTAPYAGPRSTSRAMPKIAIAAPTAAAATTTLQRNDQREHDTGPTRTTPGWDAVARGRAIRRPNLDGSMLIDSSARPQRRSMTPIPSAPTSQPSYYHVLTEGSNDSAPEPDDLLVNGAEEEGVCELDAEIQLAPEATMTASAKPFIPRTALIRRTKTGMPSPRAMVGSYVPPVQEMPPRRLPPVTVPNPKVVGTSSKEPDLGELGNFVERDVRLLEKLGWTEFVQQRRQRSDFASLDSVHHPARRLLDFYKKRGAPIKMATTAWSRERIDEALQRGAHKSCQEHIGFLKEEFIDMIQKGQWVVLPAKAVRHIPGLRVLPPGVVPQRDRRPRWIGDYTFSGVNGDTLPLAAMEAMQFGHALDRILREILLSDPNLGPVQMLKVDISDGFYRINLNIDDIPKLGLAFPAAKGEEQLIAFPLVLPMGWKNSPAIFSTATETITDLANARLQGGLTPPSHKLDDAAEAIPTVSPLDSAPVPVSILRPAKRGLPRSKRDRRTTLPRVRRIRWKRCLTSVLRPSTKTGTPSQPLRDPCLPKRTKPVSYIDVFVDDFIGLA